jgi:DNA polymerase-3 subunit beta
MVKLLPGPEITIDRSERGITLSAGRATSRIVGLPDRDFPKIPVAPESTKFHAVEGSALLAMIEATMFSVCRDGTRFHLNGALLEGTGDIMRMVTTDGHRLTMASRAVSGVVQRGVIIPAKGLQEIKRLLDDGMCHIGFSASHMFVRQAGAELAIKLTDAQFPPYGQVIPKDNPHVVTVGRKALIEAFSRARMLASETRGVRITSDSGDLVIASDNPDMGDMTERVAIEGPITTRPNDPAYAGLYIDRLIKTGCNAVYMIEALDRIDDERVTIAFPSGELEPFLLRPAGDVALGDSEFQAVIMPMRI